MSDFQLSKYQEIVGEIARMLTDDISLTDLNQVSSIERGSTYWTATVAKQNDIIHVALRITVPAEPIASPDAVPPSQG